MCVPARMSSDVVLALRGVSFTYRGAATPALRDVSLTICRGELVVVMGATGAGKTTLARCINRSIPQFQPGLPVNVRIDRRGPAPHHRFSTPRAA